MLSPERIASWSPGYRDELAGTLRARAKRVGQLSDRYTDTAVDWTAHNDTLTGVSMDRAIEEEFATFHADLRRAFERAADLADQYADELRALANRVQVDQ